MGSLAERTDGDMLRSDLVQPLPGLLKAHAEEFGDRVAFRDDRRAVRYAELAARTARLAGHLAAAGVGRGERVAFCLGNRVETVETWLAVTRAAAVGVPLNPRCTDAELAHLLDDSGAVLVVTDPEHLDQLLRLRADRTALRLWVTGDGVTGDGVAAWGELVDAEPGVPARDDLGLDEVAWMLYTSGTTGRPKGVLSTQRTCLWSVASCYVPIPGLTGDDRVVWPLPLFHSLSHIGCVLSVTAVGASARLVDGFSADDVLAAVAEDSATVLAGVPAMYHHLVTAARSTGFRAPDLRVCLVGGAITTGALRRAFEEVFDAPLLDAYGSTETCGSIAITRPDRPRVEGSCGQPVPGVEVRLVSPQTGVDVPAGVEGEVWVRGPSVMLGYHGLPEVTAAALRDGWYRTGDLARRDADGNLFVTGRHQELIIRGGEKIHPAEVEDALRSVPGVADVAVTGRPHEVLGEVPVAFVVPGPDGFDPAEAYAACRERLSYYKVPDALYEIDQVPRTASGKVTRRLLLARPARLRAVNGGHHGALSRVTWQRLDLAAAAVEPTADPATEPRRWAVVGPGGAALVEALAVASAGEVFRAYPDLAALGDDPDPPDVALLPAGVADPPDLAGRLGDLLADARYAHTRLALLTTGAVDASTPDRPDDPDLVPAAVAAWAWGRCLQAAYPDRVVLVDRDADDLSLALVPAAVAADVAQVALRAGAARHPALGPAPARAPRRPATVVEPAAPVVVTGVDGPTGAALARHLVAAHGARRLLLTPAGPPDDAVLRRLVADLADAGAATTPSDTGAAVAPLAAAGGPVGAVFLCPSAADLADDAAVAALLTLAGALDARTRHAAATAFTVAVPAALLLGAAGRERAAAAVAALHALVARRRAAGLPARLIGTTDPAAPTPPADPAAPPQPTDTAGRPVAPAAPTHAADAGAPAGGTAADLAAFDVAHDGDDLVLLAVAADAPHPAWRLPARTAGGGGAPDAAELRRRLAGLTTAEGDRLLLDLVRAATADVAGLPGPAAVRPGRAFKELGFTSVGAVALRDRLARATGVRLSATAAFDQPSPDALARHLAARLRGGPGVPVAPAAGPAAAPDAADPVVIVAMACRLPGGVGSPQELWDLVADGREGLTGFPTDRGWDLAHLFSDDPDAPGTSYVRVGGFLPDAADFDATLFSISPREALAMDPQQRLLLETSWELFERAGIDPTSLRGSATGVFTGVMHHDYAANLRQAPPGTEGYLGVGTAGSVVSGRVAYALGLEGPAVTVDTACSSSLVSLHLAAQALRAGDCDLAVAGGVAVMGTPQAFVEFSRQRGLAPDGRCKAFADAADGTGWSEGVAVLLLERLSAARRNGHPVLAVLRGSAVNSDGASNGLTAPNGPAQERVIRRALANAGLTTADVDAVEAHGTGTRLGDPIEAQALLATYGAGRGDAGPLWLGSLKSNLGHTQAAAGAAGVIKMVLALRHGTLPATLHVDAPTSEVDWAGGAVELLTEARPWPAVDRPRRAAVSSFGISGTNAHVIIEAPPADDEETTAADIPAPGTATRRLPVPWPLAAATGEALRDQAARLLAWLDGPGADADPADVGHALATTRAALEHRAVVLAGDPAAARAGLTALSRGEAEPDTAAVLTGRVADGRLGLLFGGQGGQRPGMGRELRAAYPVFAEAFDAACAELDRCLTGHAPHPVADVVAAADGTDLAARLDHTLYTQPALFAFEVALYRLLESWGVRPDALLGHSVGELAAAHVAGVFSLADAAALVAARARLMQQLPDGGAMVAVEADEAEVAAHLTDRVGLAAVNGPSSVVLSGDTDAVLAVAATLRAAGRRTSRLRVSHAFHSPRMEPMLDAFRAVAAGLTYRTPHLPVVSNVTGRPVDPARLCSPEHWAEHVRGTVRFLDGMRALRGLGVTTFLEVGPGGVLTAMAQDCLADDTADELAFVPAVRTVDGEPDALVAAVARLHVRGVAVDPAAPAGPGPRRRVDLPTYAFARRHYWLPYSAVAGGPADVGLADAGHPLLGAVLPVAGTGQVVCTGRVAVATHPWLVAPDADGPALLPATALLDLFAHLGVLLDLPTVERLRVPAPVPLPADLSVDVQVTVDAPDEHPRRVARCHVRAGDGQPWREVAEAVLAPADHQAGPAAAAAAWPPAGARPVDLDTPQRRALADGLARAAWVAGDRLCVDVRLPEDARDADAERYAVHPLVLDAALRLLPLAGFALAAGEVARLTPTDWAGVRVHATGAHALRVVLAPAGADAVTLSAVDDAGAPVLDVERVVLRTVAAPTLAGPAPAAAPAGLYAVDWLPAAAPATPVPAWALADGAPPAGPLPPLLVLRVGDGDPAAPVPDRAHAVGLDTLGVLQRWLADPRAESTRLAVAVRDGDPAHATVAGLVRVAQAEHPDRFLLLRLDAADDAGIRTALAVGPDEPEVAVRDGRALLPRLRPAEPPAGGSPAPAVDCAGPLPALAGGTVLVTGGTGGIGRHVATHLATAHGVAELVLVSRTGRHADWMDALTAAGTTVRVVAADVADRAALDAVLAPLAGRLTAVVHAAGATDDALLTGLDAARWERALRSKVHGAWHLHELTAGLDLAAFVLFSSASAVFGSPGQGNYAAGNAFLDALAAHRRAHGLPATALAWGLWATPEGMAGALTAADLARLARGGTRPLDTAAGLALFDAALHADRPALVPIGLDLAAVRAAGEAPALLRALLPPPPRRAVNADPAPASAAGFADRLAGRTEPERAAALLDLVRARCATVVGHAGGEQIEPRRPFKDLGFDSLMAVELSNRLSAATGVRLAPHAVFNHPTPELLAAHLHARLLGTTAAEVADAATVAADEPVAVVAMACRFPGGIGSPEQLWRLLDGGGDVIGDLPTDRGWPDLYDPVPGTPGRTYVRSGGFLTGIADFDAAFFGISPREALAMDPQHRLLLETSWEALERAGIDPGTLRGSRTGVFAGTHGQDYADQIASGVASDDGETTADEGHLLTGTAGSVLSGRVAYALGLEGPAVTVDTACSASLVALHLAAQALRAGDCDLALAGGVSVLSSPAGLTGFSRQRGLAADGRCKAFAEDADGFGMSEGVGVLVVERLSDARRRGHPVLALIRGTAVNQDGASNGLTAPNGPSQERVIRAALAAAGLTPADVDAVEAHGTGTPLGDPIEAEAILATYGQRPADAPPLLLGSVKSNLGHTQAAAGVAGVLKMVLAMRHGVLPRTLHAQQRTTRVDWAAGSVELLTEARLWPRADRPARAGISSFGISGTNAHVVVEAVAAEPQPGPAPPADPAALPWLLSARTPEALAGQARRLRDHLADHPDQPPRDAAWSLATTRAAFDSRAVVVAAEPDRVAAALDALAAGRPDPDLVRGDATAAGKVVFVFPGQGSQWPGMGLDLLDAAPVFAERMAACDAALRPHLGFSVLDVLRQAPDAPSLDRVDVVQPALFATMVSLAELWRSHGVRPAAVVGHSQGEIAAACVAGVLSLPDAAKVVALRSRAIRALAGHGAMASVALPADVVRDRIARHGDAVAVAAVNGPAAVVVSGEEAAVEEVLAELAADGARVRRIAVDYASHSAQVERIRADLAEALAGISPGPAAVPLFSTTDLRWLDGPELGPDYWYRNLRQPVELHRAVAELAALGHDTYVECSPHPVLTVGITETLAEHDTPHVVVGSLQRDQGDRARFLLSAAQLHVRGVAVDWRPALAGGRRVDLPTYAFEHRRYWPRPATGPGDVGAAGLDAAGHPLLGASVALAEARGHLFTGRIAAGAPAWLADHRVGETVLVPGTGLVELCLRAGDEVGCPVLDELVIEAPLALPADAASSPGTGPTGAAGNPGPGRAASQVQLTVGPADDAGRRPVAVHSRPADAPPGTPWTRHASATLSAAQPAPPAAGLAAWPPPHARPADLTGFYAGLAADGYAYGPAFQGLRAVWTGDDEVYAEVELPAGQRADADRYHLHPALLDAALHAAHFGGIGDAGPDRLLLPFAWNGVALHAAGASALRVRLTRVAPQAIALTVADATGAPVAEVASLAMRPISRAELGTRDAAVDDALFRLDWQPLAAPETPTPARVVALGRAVGAFPHHADPAALARAVDGGAAPPDAVLAPLGRSDAPAAGAPDLPDVPAASDAFAGEADRARAVAAEALALVQAWLADPRWAATPLVLLTRGAVGVHSPAEVDDPDAATAWGLVRTAQSEHPDRFVLLDADTPPTDAELTAVLAVAEPQVALRAGTPYAPRLARRVEAATLTPPAGATAWRLDTTARGSLENLTLAPTDAADAPLGPLDVRVRVRAAGLNFRDVLNALGLYPGDPGPPGGEAAGVVTEVGADVTDLRPGDRVLGVFVGCFGPVAVTDRRLLAPVPDGWTYAQAASVPVVFLTAYHGLVNLAGLRAGESVLVHAAAGGVGMAAVQLARHLGATVYATASPGKWPALRAMGIPDSHLASSRTLDFEPHFLATSGGRGVDVVLDSLAREFVDASLRLLPRGGRFVEMGKTDLRDPDRVAADHPGVAYQAYDLTTVDPDETQRMLVELMGLFAAGRLTPLPVRAWDVRQAPDAFRHVQQARHVGKVVLTVPAPWDPDGTVLLTGGTGLLGGLVARRLVTGHGVRHLLLASRGGPDAPGVAELTAELTALGATVTVAAADVADRAAVARLVAAVPAERPLTAVVHLAGVLDDGVVTALTPDRLDTVFAPKVDAARHLDEATRHLDLAGFVLFSSGAGVFGVPGQGNYAAANAYLDALATRRRGAGLPAQSYAWGLWEQASTMTAKLDRADPRITARDGQLAISSDLGMALFDAGLAAPEEHLVPTRVDVTALAGRASVPALMRGLVRRARPRARAEAAPGGRDLAGRLRALTTGEQSALLLDLVRAEAATVLGHTSTDAVKPAQAFNEIGFDSLTAVELRNRLTEATGHRLPATAIFDYPDPTALAGFLRAQLVPDGGQAAPAILAELESLERSLAETVVEAELHTQVAARLEVLVAKWRTMRGASATDHDLDLDLDQASDDEIFSLIDTELGL
ncbi:Acyl transferase domain-containing protein [Micromonospora haikouensis]|uniref:Acyl transferase domain-containing protein n=2 Tax=Micromonospora haikouensis TaxID=686309 RepID=A0A1C4XRG1_9ACTN|nr:Acyl transferase domain-containing protein [Micromonospora haikouensis]